MMSLYEVEIELHGKRLREKISVINEVVEKVYSGETYIRLIHGYRKGTSWRDYVRDLDAGLLPRISYILGEQYTFNLNISQEGSTLLLCFQNN